MRVDNNNLNRIITLSEPIVSEMGLEILCVRFLKQQKTTVVEVTLDNPNGALTVRDCSVVNRTLSRILEEEDFIKGSYNVQVSSPGFKRILRIPKDLKRFLNKKVKIRVGTQASGRKVLKGILTNSEDPMILETSKETIEIAFKDIAAANLDE